MSEPETRALAIDVGEVRIGVALSDPLRMIAHPLETWTRRGPRQDLDQIVGVVRENDVSTVVVGHPRLLSGEEGAQALSCREFALQLRSRLAACEVVLWDERLTTVQAERTLIEGNVRRRRRKQVVDAMAATLILQGFLDAATKPDGKQE